MLVMMLMLGAQAATTLEQPVGPVPTTQLNTSPGVYELWDQKRSWGTRQMTRIVNSVAAQMAWQFPEADPIMIGDLSSHGGGAMFGHITHDRGIDADIGLYQLGGRQPLGGFVDLRPEQLDAERTWALVSALLATGEVHHILLDQRLIDRLREHLLSKGASQSMVDRVLTTRNAKIPWTQMGVVRHAPRHRNHMHVRVGAPQPIRKPAQQPLQN